MTILKDYPTLYKKDIHGKIRCWKLQAVQENDLCYIFIWYGQLGAKIIENKKEVKTGKNIGKKNETSTSTQTILICDKTWKDKVEKEQYVETLEVNANIDKKFKPMLAETWNPNSTVNHKTTITFPCYIQPKLDGIRCLSYLNNSEKIVNQSRQLKYFHNLQHINNELKHIFDVYPNLVLDGELYNHNINFNHIAGIVKTEKYDEKVSLIEYHVYDCFLQDDLNVLFTQRVQLLKNLQKLYDFKNIKFVFTLIVKSKNEVFTEHSKFLENKYEGSILRNFDSKYEFHRTKHLQKYKNFEEQEFEIVGFKQGEGHDDGAVIWKCKTENGQFFDVRPIGSIKQRIEWYNLGHEYIGKMLTVTYQNLSEFGIPRFPVGKTIRDYET
jgi:ATP-dependent DNA ligase